MNPGSEIPHARPAYLVLGSSAKLSNWENGSEVAENPEALTAMFRSQRRLSSVVFDIEGARMDATFLYEPENISDQFTISKTGPSGKGRYTLMGG